MMTRARWACGIAILALTATACGMGAGGSGAGRPGQEHVVYAEQFLPVGAWALGTEDATYLSRAGCLETLVQYQDDGSLTGKLATSWEQVQPTVWDFKLREGVTFQDGTPLDAQAVAGALTHVLEAKTPGRSVNPKVIAKVEAADAATVRVTTTQPDVLLPLRMATPNSGILAPRAYAGEQIDIKGTCTGPFTVVDEQPQQSIKLARNENYWGAKPRLASGEMRFVVDGGTRVTQVQTGEAQIAAGIPAASLSTLRGDSNIKLYQAEVPRTTAMVLNNSRPPFNNPLVRKALQRAVDLDAIAASVYEGAAKPAVGPFSPRDPWAAPGATPVAYDPDEARRLLDQAGVDPSSLSFQLIAYNERPEFADLAAVIQDQLGRLGIKVEVRTGEYASFEPDVLAGKFDAYLLSRSYLIDVGEPAGYLSSDWTCEGGYNLANYCDPSTDALIKEASTLEDMNARRERYAEIGAKLQADAASVFLVHETMTTATAADVENFEIDPLTYSLFTPDLALAAGSAR